MQARIDKNLWLSGLVALAGAAILTVLYRFNWQPHEYNEYIVTNITLLLWLPLLLIILVLKKEPFDFGMTLGDKWGYKAVGLLFLVSVPAYIFAARLPQFQNYYPIWGQAAHDPKFFRYYELTYGMYLFCWEFFFRGFLLFGLKKYFNFWQPFCCSFFNGTQSYR